MRRILRWLLPLLFPFPLLAQISSGLDGEYSMAEWCGSHPFTGTQVSLAPNYALSRLQGAKKCNVRIGITYPRQLVTSTGYTKGPYNSSKHRALSAQYAKALPKDTLRKYAPWFIGFRTHDDIDCASCWGGKVIPLNTVMADANYAKSLMPDAAIGVRTDAMRASGVSGWKIDFFHAQWWASPSYLRQYGNISNYYALNAKAAAKMGVHMIYGLNTSDCAGPGTAPCSPTQVTTYGTIAANQSGNCSLPGWFFEPDKYNGAYRTAWQGVIALAKSKPFTSCKAR